jgi:hypothetical protein
LLAWAVRCSAALALLAWAGITYDEARTRFELAYVVVVHRLGVVPVAEELMKALQVLAHTVALVCLTQLAVTWLSTEQVVVVEPAYRFTVPQDLAA